MRIKFMDSNSKDLEVNNFVIRGMVDGEYGVFEEEVKFNFKNKNIIEKTLYDDGCKIIKVEKISRNEYEIRFFEEDIEDNKEEIEYEHSFEIEINCCRCGRIMQHEATYYGLVSDCYTERFYKCVAIDEEYEDCGYEVVISLDDC